MLLVMSPYKRSILCVGIKKNNLRTFLLLRRAVTKTGGHKLIAISVCMGMLLVMSHHNRSRPCARINNNNLWTVSSNGMVPDCGENFSKKPVVNDITETVRFCAGSVRSFYQGDEVSCRNVCLCIVGLEANLPPPSPLPRS